MIKMNNLRLRFLNVIDVKGLKIKSPTIEDIVEIGEDTFKKYLIPFTITTDILVLDEDMKQEFKTFDLFFIKDGDDYYLKHNDETFVEILINSLKFYFQEEVSIMTAKDFKYANIMDLGYPDNILENIYYILIENNGIIDRDNFDEVADMILKINYAKKIEIEPEPEFQNDRQRDIYNKIMEGRRRKAEKESQTLGEMIDVVQFGGKSFVSYKEIKDFTIQQLIHAYMTILSIDNFQINFGQYQAGADPQKLDLEHWVSKIKQINKNQ